MDSSMRRLLPFRPALAALILASLAPAIRAGELWTDDRTTQAPASGRPSVYRSVLLDPREWARQRPGRRQRRQTDEIAQIVLPLPEGGSSRFRLRDSEVIPPSLATRFPALRSLVGHDDAGRVARVDIGPNGALHAAVRTPSGEWALRPLSMPAGGDEATVYIVYHLADRPASTDRDAPGDRDDIHTSLSRDPIEPPVPETQAPRRRYVLRLAASADRSFVDAHGGTTEAALSAIARTVNRVNAVYETELGIRLELVDPTDQLIASGVSDPFATLTDLGALVDRNATFIPSVMPLTEFDLGHLFHAHTGPRVTGLASVATACSDEVYTVRGRTGSWKASAASAWTPNDDEGNFAYVLAHEIGHQLGALHTFNALHRSRTGTSAVEPAAGSTIMSYARSVEPRLQVFPDPYLHARTIEEIQTYLDTHGTQCPLSDASLTPAPRLALRTAATLFIPAGTPFRLGAHLVDPPTEARPTYTFDQIDTGVAQDTPILIDRGNGPLFRSRAPSSSGWQSFPSMDVLLGREALGLGDTLSIMERALHFRAIGRDNLDTGPHIASADIQVNVVDTGKAFEVLLPIEGARLKRGTTRKVRWRVAGTTRPPILCDKVDIHLSIDDGQTFGEHPVAQSVPNSGMHMLAIPPDLAPTETARLMVSCPAQSFFAMSSGHFSIR